MESFGTRLKREREQRGMTLEEISLSTKIGTRFLRALEQQQFDQLPGGIFNKGFVRAYARHLGIDENQAIADYLAASGGAPPSLADGEQPAEPEAEKPKKEVQGKERSKEVQAKPVQPKVVLPRESRPAQAKELRPIQTPEIKIPLRELPSSEEPEAAGRIPWGMLAIGLSIVAFSFGIWGFYARDAREGPVVYVPPQVYLRNTSPPPPSPQSSSLKKTAATEPALNASAAGDQPVSSTPAAEAPIAQGPGAASSDAGELSTPMPAPGAFLLSVKAREDSWISIEADGKEVMKDTLAAKAEKSVEARKEIVVKAGNLGALDFVFNGKKVPVEGRYDEVKTLTFDANGLEPAGAAKPPVAPPH